MLNLFYTAKESFVPNCSYLASLLIEHSLSASPKWIIQPTDSITTLGSSIIVHCVAAGSPPPRISWFKKTGKVENLFQYIFYPVLNLRF